MEEEQKTITITKLENGEFCIDILENGYNIIKNTIYNDELAKKILKLIKKHELLF